MKIREKIHFSKVDSTNSWSKRNVDFFERDKITIVTADFQFAGRGRFKRQWISPFQQNIYATFNFFVAKDSVKIENIPQILALSAYEIIQGLGFSPHLKWPNDILISNKKIGGILCETILMDNLLAVILGIGLNINMTKEFLDLVDQPATSLMNEEGKKWNIEQILELLQNTFISYLIIFLKEGFSPFYEKYKYALGDAFSKEISFANGKIRGKGILHSLNPDGTINILQDSKELKKLNAGEIAEKKQDQ